MKRFTYRDRTGLHFIDSCYTCGGFIKEEKLKAHIAELEDKIESGQLVELPVPFIEESENADGETTYLVYRSKVETYCPSEDVFTDKLQAEVRLKELLEEVNDI